jgi:transposase-like protein
VSTFFFFGMIGLKGSDIMSRPKGGTNRKWTKEDKLRIVKRNLIDHVGQRTIVKEEGISGGLLWRWISQYQEHGEKAFDPQTHNRGNHFAALHTSKNLSELDRLRLENAKQKIEIERLKKGYIVKGAGTEKEFVTSLDPNMK